MSVPLQRERVPHWAGLAGALWVQIAAGNAYNFPLFSDSLKSVLDLSQFQLAFLGFANDAGENMGILPGLFLNRFPNKPWIALLIGALQCFFGYGIIWLALTKTIDSVPFWVLWLALCAGASSGAWFSRTALVTNLHNFPHHRGLVASILKGYSGLGAAVYAAFYSVLLNNSSHKLLLFLALGIPSLCPVMMFLVRRCTPAATDVLEEYYCFIFIQFIIILLGIDVFVATTCNHWFCNSLRFFFVLVMVILFMAPFAIPVVMSFAPANVTQPSASPVHVVGSAGSSFPQDGNSDTIEPLLEPSSSAANRETHSDKTKPLVEKSSSAANRKTDSGTTEPLLEKSSLAANRETDHQSDRVSGQVLTPCQALARVDFWLVFSVYFVGVSSGVTVLNNLAQIGIAQGFNSTNVLLSVFSSSNFLGRLLGGFISERYARSNAIPRTVWMTITQVIMAVTYVAFASALNVTLAIATLILGVCYGFQFSVMVATACDLFDLTRFGIIFDIISAGNPVGTFVFLSIVAGFVYDNEAAKKHSKTCVGLNCFRRTFFTLAGVCALGIVLSVVLTERIRPIYRRLQEEKQPQAQSEQTSERIG